MFFENLNNSKYLTLRITILISLFIWTSCNGQQGKTDQTSVENFKLTPPNPELIDKDLTLSEVYKNCVAFKLDKNVVVLNEQQNFLNKGKDFEDFILNHSEELKKRKIFILDDSSIKYSEIINLLDLFQTLKIEKFKIIDMDLYFKSPPPIIVDTPKSVSSKLDLNDSTNFIITIVDNSINIQLLKRTEHFKSPEELDKFIKTNINKIDISKIYLKSIASLPYGKFKNVIAILKKYEFYNFKIIVDED
jgi:biopolymer transport protein ExbD